MAAAGAGDEATRAKEVETGPYVSWLTVKNTVEKMAKEGGVPSQVDRSYLSNMPGSTQSQLIAAMKWLGFIGQDMRPTPLLEQVVAADEAGRKEIIKTLLQDKYPGPSSLPALATQQQLEDAFRKMGFSGATLRKGIAFYLRAASFGDLAVSQHFKTPKEPAGNGAERKPRKQSKPAGRASSNIEQPSYATSGTLHPLIQGLIQELPPINGAFPKAKQEDWLQLAQVTFRMIYNTGNSAPVASALDDDAGGDDD